MHIHVPQPAHGGRVETPNVNPRDAGHYRQARRTWEHVFAHNIALRRPPVKPQCVILGMTRSRRRKQNAPLVARFALIALTLFPYARSLAHYLHNQLARPRAIIQVHQDNLLPGSQGQPAGLQRDRQRWPQ